MDTSTGSRADVVVGADGSDLALHAVGWAATEAQLRGLPLRIVHRSPVTVMVVNPGTVVTAAAGLGPDRFAPASDGAPDLPRTRRRETLAR